MRYSDSTSLGIHPAQSSESAGRSRRTRARAHVVEKGERERYPQFSTDCTAALIVQPYTSIDLSDLIVDNRQSTIGNPGTKELVNWRSHVITSSTHSP